MDFARTFVSLFRPGPAIEPVAQPTPSIGQLGRYRLLSLVGDGAMGAIYAAEDPLLSRAVALKTVNVQLPDEERRVFEATFLHEARAAAKLNHPCIVTIFDAGTSERGPYIAMELLEGADLRMFLSRGERFSPSRAAEIIYRVAEALDYAHSMGIVHRDIKPANIYLAGGKFPKVLDFGIARITRGASTIIHEAKVLGSPSYMSPETVEGKGADGRSDVFSLGVVFYELLTGKTPFWGDNLPDLLDNIVKRPAKPPHEVNIEVPLELSRIVGKALAKKPAERYQRAGDMADDLRRWASMNRARRLLQSQGESPAILPKPERRSSWAAVVAVGLVVSSLVAVVVWWWAQGVQTPTVDPVVIRVPNKPAPGPVPPMIQTVDPANGPSVSPPMDVKGAVDKTQTKRASDLRDRSKPAATSSTTAVEPKPIQATGSVSLAISPWAEVFVDGVSRGASPPLTKLTLPIGRHVIELRNGEFEPHTRTVEVESDNPVAVRYKFGL
jgi:serine/threonine-protein kinase